MNKEFIVIGIVSSRHYHSIGFGCTRCTRTSHNNIPVLYKVANKQQHELTAWRLRHYAPLVSSIEQGRCLLCANHAHVKYRYHHNISKTKEPNVHCFPFRVRFQSRSGCRRLQPGRSYYRPDDVNRPPSPTRH